MVYAHVISTPVTTTFCHFANFASMLWICIHEHERPDIGTNLILEGDTVFFPVDFMKICPNYRKFHILIFRNSWMFFRPYVNIVSV